MNSNSSHLWDANSKRRSKIQATIEIGKTLSLDPTALVECPFCHNDTLEVKDLGSNINPEYIEREVSCPSCGPLTYIRLRNPDPSNPPAETSEALDFAARAAQLFHVRNKDGQAEETETNNS